MARAAYLGGAEYFYRINDDTELVANWAAVFVKALNASPSSLGPLGLPTRYTSTLQCCTILMLF